MNYSEQFRVDPEKFSLSKCNPAFHGEIKSADADQHREDFLEELRDLQVKLYADGRTALLMVLQAMDAAGKDGTIKHVMSGVNPAGCEVSNFKTPSAEELQHDFLWRVHRRAPEKGRIGIFNRSHYEEVLAVRVHPQFLAGQGIDPKKADDPKFWQKRYDDINAFERHLHRSGTRIVKFFLHLSKEEQKKRFLSRIDDAHKNWKFSKNDIAERAYWDQYQTAYEEMLRATSQPNAPWYVIPADRKWFSRLAVAAILVDELKAIDPKFPRVNSELRKELAEVKTLLESESP